MCQLLLGPVEMRASAAIRIPSAMVRERTLCRTFRSLKNNKNPRSKIPSISSTSSPSPIKLPASQQPEPEAASNSDSRTWCVYLILSTNAPIKTYVGVTTNFTRRLRQHNGELKGGAKASSAGRPWICACIVRGFSDHSEACSFESKWKNISKKLTRKRPTDDLGKHEDDHSYFLLQHRQTALNRVKSAADFSHLEIDWQLHVS